MIYLPRESPRDGKSMPLVFIFHGHGGNMRHAARAFSIQSHWPQAICVYPQGLPTVGRLTDPEGRKAGWQAREGDGGNRDLKFFDTMLDALKKEQKIDHQRIYATGHSNGGAFTYLLWGQRGDILAATAPSAAVATGQFRQMKPMPVMVFAGQNDPLVKYAWQKTNITLLRRLNGCDATKPLHLGENQISCGEKTPVWAWVHPGGHGFWEKAPGLMVHFFRSHPKIER